MKKFAKMSLVAAVAVAGLTTANAQPLSEAIKNVDVSGALRWRNQQTGVELGNGGDYNKYGAVAYLKSKVNDDFTVATTFEVATTSLELHDDADDAANVQLTHANVVYTGIANTTIIAGKQAINTPWTVAHDLTGTNHYGTGVVAVNTSTPVTLIGAYFQQSNLAITGVTDGTKNIYVVGALANIAGVSLEAMYADYADTFDSYTVAASYKADIDAVSINASARYTSLDLDSVDTDNKNTQASLSVGAGMLTGSVSYSKNDEEGGTTGFDGTAKTTGLEGYVVSQGTTADSELLRYSLSAKVLPELTLTATYDDLEIGNADDKSETSIAAVYSAAKNLKFTVAVGEAETDNSTDGSFGRLQVDYSF